MQIDWATLLGLGFALIAQTVIIGLFVGRALQRSDQNTKAIELLWEKKASKEQLVTLIDGLARIEKDNLKYHAECEGKMTAQREEFNARMERANQRIEHSEKNRNADAQVTAEMFGKFGATLDGVKQTVDRLVEIDVARSHAPAPQRSAFSELLEQLKFMGELKAMAKTL